jgi:hypothetical protein
MTAPRNSHISEKPLDGPDEHLMLQHRLGEPANLDLLAVLRFRPATRVRRNPFPARVLFPGPRCPTGFVGPRRAQPTIPHPGERHREVPVAPLLPTRRPQAPLPLRQCAAACLSAPRLGRTYDVAARQARLSRSSARSACLATLRKRHISAPLSRSCAPLSIAALP